MNIKIIHNYVMRVLGISIFLLVLGHIATIFFRFYLQQEFVFGFVPMFNLDGEANLPALYSALQLLFASIIFLFIAIYRKSRQLQDHKQWFGLFILFFFLVHDEVTSIHELLTIPMRALLGTTGLLYYAWVIPYLILLLVLVVVYWKFFFNLEKWLQIRLVAAAFVFLFGAVGFEMVGGLIASSHDPANALMASVMTLFEETFELLGILILINSLLLYLENNVKSLTINFIN